MNEAGKLGAVFDCMVFLQAIASAKGPAAACLTMLDEGGFVLYASQEVLQEVRDVLTRPLVRRKNSDLTDERIGAFFQRRPSL